MNALVELYYHQKLNSDVTLVVCGKEFKSHKHILRFVSPVLSAMFDFPGNENKDQFDLSETDENEEIETSALVTDLLAFELMYKVWYGIGLHESCNVSINLSIRVYKLCRSLQCQYPIIAHNNDMIWMLAQKEIKIKKDSFSGTSAKIYKTIAYPDGTYKLKMEDDSLKSMDSYLNEIVGEELFESIHYSYSHRLNEHFICMQSIVVNNIFHFQCVGFANLFDLILFAFKSVHSINS